MWAMRYAFADSLVQLTNLQKHVLLIILMFISLQYVLVLCNSIGTPLDPKYIDIGKQFATLTVHFFGNSRRKSALSQIHILQNSCPIVDCN